MYIVILLVLVSAVRAQNGSELIMCDGVVFNNVYYDKELLFSGLGRPYNLMMHKFSGVIFFSHTIQNGTQVDFGIMACHIEKRTCRDIHGVPGGYALAYDGGNDDIYFGGHDGIYKYNFLTKKAEFFAEEGKSIWGIFVRRNFYYIEYPTQKLYVYQDDTFVKVAEATDIEVDNFFISKQLDIYFSNKTALYKVEKNSRQPIVLNDEIAVRQIAEDIYGDIYFCASDGIYVEDKPYHKSKKVADIHQAFGMTFDEVDHIIYSDKDAIYRMRPSKYSKLCYDAILDALEKKKQGEGRRSLPLISNMYN
ncbi:ommochrome-binding protein-like isoform X2 [Anticarsia gemmatalis]